MSPNPPHAMTPDEHAAIPNRVDTLERNFEAFRRDVADEFRGIRADSARQSDAILTKIDAQGQAAAAAQADALRRGQFNLRNAFGSFIGAGGFILALVGAGATAIQAPINAAISRNANDIKKLEDSYMSRPELMVRFGAIDRDLDRGATALSKLADGAVMKPELDYRLTVLGKARDEAFANIDKRLDRLRTTTDQLESAQVSRAEHKDRWESEEKRLDGIQRQFDEHIRSFNDRQQHRIDAMEAAPRR